MHLSDWVHFIALSQPDTPAFITPRARLSYRHFDRAINAATHRLHAAEVRPGSTAAILVRNPALCMVLLFALNRLGVAVQTLLYAPADKLNLQDSFHADVVVCDEATVFPFKARSLVADLSWLEPKEEYRPFEGLGFASSADVCFITTSSGTTGTPKGIPLTVYDFEQRYRQEAIAHLAARFGDKTLVLLGPSTSWGANAYLQTLWSGGTVVANFGARAPRAIERFKVDRIIGSNWSVEELVRQLKSTPADVSSVKMVVSGGSLMPASQSSKIEQMLCRYFILGYGSAEVGYVASAPARLLRGDSRAAGYLVPWMEAEVIDENGNVLAPGQEGELRFRCVGMAHGYVGDAAFKDGWFYPGDLGSIGSDRMLRVVGRKDEIINAGGIKIDPAAIEKALKGAAGVADAAAFQARSAESGEEFWVAVVARENVNEKELRAACRRQLKAFPRLNIFVVDALPRNAMGKVSLQDLRTRVATMDVRERS